MKVKYTGGKTTRLSYEQAEEIRRKFRSKKYSRQELADEYKVSRDNINKIIRKATHTKPLWEYGENK